MEERHELHESAPSFAGGYGPAGQMNTDVQAQFAALMEKVMQAAKEEEKG